MVTGQKKKTARGVYRQDSSGLWHYAHMKLGHVEMAIKDAIKHRPGVAWFWFNGTPSPIFIDDDVDALLMRWEAWRLAYQGDVHQLLISLEALAIGKK